MPTATLTAPTTAARANVLVEVCNGRVTNILTDEPSVRVIVLDQDVRAVQTDEENGPSDFRSELVETSFLRRLAGFEPSSLTEAVEWLAADMLDRRDEQPVAYELTVQLLRAMNAEKAAPVPDALTEEDATQLASWIKRINAIGGAHANALLAQLGIG